MCVCVRDPSYVYIYTGIGIVIHIVRYGGWVMGSGAEGSIFDLFIHVHIYIYHIPGRNHPHSALRVRSFRGKYWLSVMREARSDHLCTHPSQTSIPLIHPTHPSHTSISPIHPTHCIPYIHPQLTHPYSTHSLIHPQPTLHPNHFTDHTPSHPSV